MLAATYVLGMNIVVKDRQPSISSRSSGMVILWEGSISKMRLKIATASVVKGKIVWRNERSLK
jgi:hypothetical protein